MTSRKDGAWVVTVSPREGGFQTAQVAPTSSWKGRDSFWLTAAACLHQLAHLYKSVLFQENKSWHNLTHTTENSTETGRGGVFPPEIWRLCHDWQESNYCYSHDVFGIWQMRLSYLWLTQLTFLPCNHFILGFIFTEAIQVWSLSCTSAGNQTNNKPISQTTSAPTLPSL